MRRLPILAMILLVTTIARARPAEDAPTYGLEFEAGPVWQSYNDVEIPNDGTASRFSLTDVVGGGPWTAARVQLTWNVTGRHGLRLLWAPLQISESGRLDGPITFAGRGFAIGEADAVYRFDSYRLGYLYRFRETTDWTWWIGFTAKIRSAEISLEQGGIRAVKDDLGFVPLLHIAGERRLGDHWRLRFDADALAGGPGRAEDLSVRLGRSISRRMSLAAGYRMVEGGADVEPVYSFAWLHYAFVSLRLDF